MPSWEPPAAILLLRRGGGGGGSAGSAGGGAGRLRGAGGRQVDEVELRAADAAVAVAVDRDPVAVPDLLGRQLLAAEVAVLVAVEALEERRVVAAGDPRAEKHCAGKRQPFEFGQREHPARLAGAQGYYVCRSDKPVSAARQRRRRAGTPGCAWTAAAALPTAPRCPCGTRCRGRRRSPTTGRGRSRLSARPGASRRSRRSSAPRWACSR